MRFPFSYLAAFLVVGGLASAQQAPPPRGAASADIDGKKVSIDYGQPTLKGRAFAELSKELPADRMWRAGMNQVTTLSTATDLMIGGKKVPAGRYSLYVHVPESGDWSLAVNSDLGVPLKQIFAQAPPHLANEPWPHMEDYGKSIGSKEVARVTMKKMTGAAQDKLTYAIDGGMLTLAWGDQKWGVEVKPAK